MWCIMAEGTFTNVVTGFKSRFTKHWNQSTMFTKYWKHPIIHIEKYDKSSSFAKPVTSQPIWHSITSWFEALAYSIPNSLVRSNLWYLLLCGIQYLHLIFWPGVLLVALLLSLKIKIKTGVLLTTAAWLTTIVIIYNAILLGLLFQHASEKTWFTSHIQFLRNPTLTVISVESHGCRACVLMQHFCIKLKSVR